MDKGIDINGKGLDLQEENIFSDAILVIGDMFRKKVLKTGRISQMEGSLDYGDVTCTFRIETQKKAKQTEFSIKESYEEPEEPNSINESDVETSMDKADVEYQKNKDHEAL